VTAARSARTGGTALRSQRAQAGAQRLDHHPGAERWCMRARPASRRPGACRRIRRPVTWPGLPYLAG